MRSLNSHRRLFCAALIAVGTCTGWAADSGKSGAAESARSTGAGTQRLVEQATAQRERMLAEHAALTKQLKTATEEQRKAILARLEEQRKAFDESQRTLAKLIRDEQRRQRQESAAPRR